MATRHSSSKSTIPAVGYLRRSTTKQEKSLDDQRREIEQYAAEHGYHIVRWFQDDGISGDATDKRLGFQAMHKAACNGRDFDCIMVWDLDRFGRFNSLEAGYWIHPLVKAGVNLVTVTDGPVNWLDFTGRILSCIKQEGKHQFLVDLSRNTVRGMQKLAASGAMAFQCFGYRLEAGKLVIESSEAPTVARIFQEYTSGASLRGIANGLNEDCIPSPSGRCWSSNSVSKTLQRKKYTGMFTFGERPCGKFSHAEPVRIPDHHPAIIDQQAFDRVQARRAGNRKRTAPNRTYLLSGLIRCGCCGRTMGGRGGDKYPAYVCNGYIHGGTAACTYNTMSEAPLVAAIVRKLQMEAFAPEKLDKLRAAIRRHQEAEHDRPVVDVITIRKRLEAAERKVDAAADRILEVPKSIASTLYGRLEKLQAERDQLRAALEAAQRPDRAQGDPTGSGSRSRNRCLVGAVCGDPRGNRRTTAGIAVDLHRQGRVAV